MNWYYEYEVTVVEDNQDAMRRGVISAGSYGEAASILEEFYGEEMLRINSLYCACDCLYEFNNESSDFDIVATERD